jgi:SAM-dependent methyltransferase
MAEEAARRSPGAKVVLGDVCDAGFDVAFDFVVAWDSIWHIDPERHRELLARLAGFLAPGGVLVFTTGGVEAPDERANPMNGVLLRHSAPGVGNTLRWLDEFGLSVKHLEYDQHPLDHVFVVARREG